MLRIFALLTLSTVAALGQVCSTAVYPGAVATNSQVLVAADNIQTSNSATQAPTDTVLVVANPSGWLVNMIATVGTPVAGVPGSVEQELVTGIAGNVLTVTRAYAGTSAQTHLAGSFVSAYIDACYHQRLSAEIKAIENTLGANLSNIPSSGIPGGGSQTQYLQIQPNTGNNTTLRFNGIGSVSSSDYNFPSQTPGGVITGGFSASISLSPCPLGVNGSDASHYVYLAGGSGTAESVLITGGSCASGATSGTLVFTPANTHSGAWTVSSASSGVQEAINSGCVAGATGVTVASGTYTWQATVTIGCSNTWLVGSGIYGTLINRTGDFGDTVRIADNLQNVTVTGLSITQTINYAAGPPPTIANRPTSGAHIHMKGCNTCNVIGNRLLNMPYAVDVDTSAFVHIEKNQIQTVWDYANAGVQVGIAGIYLHHSAALQGFPTYVYVRDNSVTGYLSASRTITVNGNNLTLQEGVGAKYAVWIASCEVCFVENNNLEANDYDGVYLAQLANHGLSDALLNIKISNNYIDYNRLSGIAFDNSANPTATFALGTEVIGNTILGSNGGLNGISSTFTIGGGSVPSQWGGVVNDNYIDSTLGSGMSLLGSYGVGMTGNHITGYNGVNSYPTNSFSCSADPTGCTGDRVGNSAIYMSQDTSRMTATGNYLGGNLLGTVYDGATVFTVNGITIGQNPTYGTPVDNTAPNFDAGVQAVASRSPAVPYDPAFFTALGPISFINLSSIAVSGCGTLDATSTILSGRITSGTTGSCTPTITSTTAAATNGFSCSMQNITHPGSTNAMYQGGTNTSAIAFTGTTISGDVLVYTCAAR